MDNFYHDFNVKEDNKGHIKKLELRENTKTERNMSIDKQKIISHRAGSKENRQINNKESFRKMKKKYSVGLALQTSLKNFFRK